MLVQVLHSMNIIVLNTNIIYIYIPSHNIFSKFMYLFSEKREMIFNGNLQI